MPSKGRQCKRADGVDKNPGRQVYAMITATLKQMSKFDSSMVHRKVYSDSGGTAIINKHPQRC